MLARPKKRDLTPEQRASITQASAKQTGSMMSPKTYDPNYPLFSNPVNDKVLVYIPNHIVQESDGSVHLRWDKFASHQCRIGKAYSNIRCCGEIVNEALGFDGSCPACSAVTDSWTLYSYKWKQFCAVRGLDPESEEVKEQYKNDRKELMGEMAIQGANLFLTFPVVLIECEPGKTVPKKDANGQIVGTPMFYTVLERTYADKWLAAFDALGDEEGIGDKNPAGRWAVLNYMYTPKTGTHNKRDSARNLKVSFKTMGESYRDWEKHFDNMTVDWTPEVAQDVLVQNALRSMDEMNEAVEELIRDTRAKIETYKIQEETKLSGVVPVSAPATDAEQALQNFGAVPVTETPASQPVGTGSAPQAPIGELPVAPGAVGIR